MTKRINVFKDGISMPEGRHSVSKPALKVVVNGMELALYAVHREPRCAWWLVNPMSAW